jgi:hypothetical protein
VASLPGRESHLDSPVSEAIPRALTGDPAADSGKGLKSKAAPMKGMITGVTKDTLIVLTRLAIRRSGLQGQSQEALFINMFTG